VRRCLVTGVAGFIGSHLTQRLLAEGVFVRGVDALTDYYDGDIKLSNLSHSRDDERFEWIEADLNTADLAPLLQDIDVVFHLAGQPGVRGSWGTSFTPYVRNNIEATQRLLEAARGSAIERLVYASSSSVYGRVETPMREDGPTRPHSPYGVTKLSAEQLCLLYARNFGVPACAVRYFTVYGPRQRPDMAFARFLAALANDAEVSIFGDGLQTRDFTFVGDAVEGTVAAALLGVPGEVYNLGGGSRVSLKDAIGVMERVSGRRLRVAYSPTEDGDVVETLAETAKARSQLDYRPVVDIERGLWLHAQTYGLQRTAATKTLHRRTASTRAPRVLIYSHDTFGLGHLRRNLAIASHLLQRERPYEALLLTGSPVISDWPTPAGLQIESLPPVVKIEREEYIPRDASQSFSELKAKREHIIRKAILRFRPDIFLVDHAPAGMKGELLEALALIRRELPATHTVIGLRDVIDSADNVIPLWRKQGIYDLLEWAYDRILVYGSRELYATDREYQFPATLRTKVRYCGYIARPPRRLPSRSASPTPTILVTTGGGGDGFPLMQDYLRASALLPSGAARSVLVLGPLMEPQERQALESAARGRPDVMLIPYATELLDVLESADLVVAMGGYNTSAEILASEKPAVIVPRTTPREEQLVRARILARLGLVWLVESDRDLVARLSTCLRAALAGERPSGLGKHAVDVDGVERVGLYLDELTPDEAAVESAAR
jgi:predicted glycosyltransferase/nucleoside-diphosphate-sugar epimerase